METCDPITQQENSSRLNPYISDSDLQSPPFPPFFKNHHHPNDVVTTVTNTITTRTGQDSGGGGDAAALLLLQQQKKKSMEAMREMIFRIAMMQQINIDPESVKAPRRKNVKISKDPQSVAARHRREKISERIRILQRLVPGGTKMDTASMLDEAAHYLKFLKKQLQSLQQQHGDHGTAAPGGSGQLMMMDSNYIPAGMSAAAGVMSYSNLMKSYCCQKTPSPSPSHMRMMMMMGTMEMLS